MTDDKKKGLKANFIQFVKFNIVGILNTAVDFCVFTLLTILGLNAYIAQCISYACGVLNSYLLNTRWTFAKEHGVSKTHIEFIKFIAVNIVSLGVSLGMLYICRNVFGIDEEILCKLIATPVAMVVNFTGNKLFVFNKEK